MKLRTRRLHYAIRYRDVESLEPEGFGRPAPESEPLEKNTLEPGPEPLKKSYSRRAEPEPL